MEQGDEYCNRGREEGLTLRCASAIKAKPLPSSATRSNLRQFIMPSPTSSECLLASPSSFARSPQLQLEEEGRGELSLADAESRGQACQHA